VLPSSVWLFTKLAEVDVGLDAFEAGLYCCSRSFRFEGVLDELEILSTDES
jgi:hypothetical protein